MSAPADAFTAALLKKTGLMNAVQIDDCLATASKDGDGVIAAALKLEICREDDLLKKLGELLGFPWQGLGAVQPTKEALLKLPAKAANQYCALPLSVDQSGTLLVVVPDPLSTGSADALRLVAGGPVKLALNTRDEIQKAVTKFYGVGADAIDKMVDDGRYAVDDLSAVTQIDVNAEGAEASIVKFVNQIIVEADRRGATDIHIEPMEDELRIRYRIDGMLHKVDVPPQLNKLKAAIISRIKVMANLDIAERRLPMDGRIGITMPNGEKIDIRVSTMPIAYGESISLRLLAKSGNFIGIKDLGFNDFDFGNVVKLINRPNGIFLVTGPTGSGKSTSLYAFLHEVNRMQVRILTAEDPIEYQMKGINQVLVNADIGLTFARALRAFLRQDPDIIMVGEIRDGETADIAINASLTGHMVFSTLHTNDAAGAFARLMDMGCEPFLVASAVAGVMAQRLVRRLCPICKREVPLNEKMYDLAYPPAKNTVWEPVGCEKCNGTGYKGRRGLFELLVVTEDIGSAIIARKSSQEIRDIALTHGMKRLREDGWAKAFQGVTSVEEVMRVTEEDAG